MRSRSLTLAAVLASVALLLGACGASGSSRGTSILRSKGTDGPGGGTATIAAAGSLEGVIQTHLQPAFEKATGDHLLAKFAGSAALTQIIKDGEINPGAFVSVGTAPIEALWPKRSHFALSLATDPLVVAYSNQSRFAPQLNAIREHHRPLKDLFSLLERPGFRLGRTDPNLDPQGGYFMLMFDRAEKLFGLPADTAARILGTSKNNAVGSSSQVVDEDALPTDIGSGTFDAGSEYLTEARQYHLEYISLPPALDFAAPADQSSYASSSLRLASGKVFTGGLITLDDTFVSSPPGQPRSKADQQADQAWLAFLLSARGRALLSKAGYVLQKPSLVYAPGYSSAASVLAPPILKQYERLRG